MKAIKRKTVLVAEANSIGSLAVIRSLGRADFFIIAISCDDDPIGFSSRYADVCLVCPHYNNKKEFIAWLHYLFSQYTIDLIIPSEGFSLAIKDEYDKFAHLIPCVNNKDIFYASFNKYDLFEKLQSSRNSNLLKNLPPFFLIEDPNALPSIKNKLGNVIYAKGDAQYCKKTNDGLVSQITLKNDDSLETLTQLLNSYEKLTLQGHVDGVGVGVFILIWKDEVYAHFMHRRIHEVPYTGGVSSYRMSFWHDAIYHDALDKIKFLKWEGVCMLEYRWDQKTDEFYLIEINSRFWGSLHLALYAGIDFPKILADLFFSTSKEKHLSYNMKTKSRITTLEIGHLVSLLKNIREVPLRFFYSSMRFLINSINPQVKNDLWFTNDTKPYFHDLKNFFCINFMPKLRKMYGRYFKRSKQY